MRHSSKRHGGWNIIEILPLLVAAGIILFALYGTFQAHGPAGGLKWTGLFLLVLVPLMAVLIWKNERDNNKRNDRLRAQRESGRQAGEAGGSTSPKEEP